MACAIDGLIDVRSRDRRTGVYRWHLSRPRTIPATIAAASAVALPAACGGRPGVTPLPFTPEGATACRFTVGFREFRAAMPDLIGDCTENERSEPNGDVAQRTTNGLLVWRRRDGYIAFTDGRQTWIQGPNGIESRPNGQLFPWESPAPAAVSPTAPRPADAGPRPSVTTAPGKPATPPPKPPATVAPSKPAIAPPRPATPPPRASAPAKKP